MKISVICFTNKGENLARRVFRLKEENEISIYRRHQDEKAITVNEWTQNQFQEKNALLYIGATGIAIRSIAPFVRDKLNDSPVLCMDEEGQFIIPLLSGHVGGANELAMEIARKSGAVPIITAATDVNDTWKVDIFAKENALTIQNKDGIAKISSKVLANEMVDIVISRDLTDLSHAVLRLKPKEYILGIGCRKGKRYEELEAFIEIWLKKLNIERTDILAIASIDIKKKETGIIKWSSCNRVPFLTFTPEELSRVEGNFASSEFVKRSTGVNNVCERSAMKAAGEGGELVLSKQSMNGMTISIVRKKWWFDVTKQKGIIIDEEYN